MTEGRAGDRPIVLVVDDDDGIRESIEDLLADEGYQVATAADGAAALAWLRAAAAPPAALLLDLMMPGMDGWQVLEVIAREGLVAADRVVVITAHRDPKVPAGVECVRKPMKAEVVLEVVARRCFDGDRRRG